MWAIIQIFYQYTVISGGICYLHIYQADYFYTLSAFRHDRGKIKVIKHLAKLLICLFFFWLKKSPRSSVFFFVLEKCRENGLQFFFNLPLFENALGLPDLEGSSAAGKNFGHNVVWVSRFSQGSWWFFLLKKVKMSFFVIYLKQNIVFFMFVFSKTWYSLIKKIAVVMFSV